jgi:hypothetical protein
MRKEADRTSQRERQHDSANETPVSDSVCDERFLRCVSGFFAIEVVTNQEVGAETDAFPADKHQDHVICQDQRQHRKHEQVQECKEPVETRLTMHVSHGEYMDKKTDKSDEQGVGAAEPVHCERKVGIESSHLQPRPDVIEYGLFAS